MTKEEIERGSRVLASIMEQHRSHNGKMPLWLEQGLHKIYNKRIFEAPPEKHLFSIDFKLSKDIMGIDNVSKFIK